LAKSEWQKAQSCQQIAKKKLELCVQKIFEACLGIWQPSKGSIFVIHVKKPHINTMMKLMPEGHHVLFYLE